MEMIFETQSERSEKRQNMNDRHEHKKLQHIRNNDQVMSSATQNSTTINNEITA